MILKLIQDRLIYFHPGEVLTLSDVDRYHLFVQIKLCNKAHPVDRLVDLSGSTRVGPDMSFRRTVEIIRAVLLDGLGEARVAIFTSRAPGLEMARFIEIPGIRVLESLGAALEYLGAAELWPYIVLGDRPEYASEGDDDLWGREH